MLNIYAGMKCMKLYTLWPNMNKISICDSDICV
ncbi:hypothetical protein F383_37990 [Gossypium arboreum]|uniref:Uncharacterized protein n=1 Tax=Gossypium arboreum TaxID=29729 RepID=A0A0B0M9U6_GOSAR|nr:hypothetical protein F383_37990 [Gossypium arboreum]